MFDDRNSSNTNTGSKLRPAERDIVALGIAIAAIILFVGTGGTVMPQIVRSWMGTGSAPDVLLTNAVLLNIALLVFGWRRYADLRREVEVRRKAEQRARALAEHDALTGCRNRLSGPPAIDALIADARAAHMDVAVLMADLDNFKQINDLNGHKVGDAVLQAVTERMHAQLPPDGILVRIGGDEFVCAFAFPLQDRDRVDAAADDLIRATSAAMDIDGLNVTCTVSVGLARLSQVTNDNQPLTADRLIHRADIAMYHAKKHGRNRYFWFEMQMEDELRFRCEIEAGLREGLEADEFFPYYEQQIDLETGKLAGFEMLARWESEKFGLIGPSVFIPIAEEIDVISELSETLIRKALKDAMEWDPSLSLSVNISPVQLRDPWFAQKLLHMLVEHRFPPHRLEIEITESCLHENVATVRSMLMSLRNQGIRVSLDDFGTGYSSLAQLRSLPFDRLKIDRSFVTEITKADVGSELVHAIISLGRGLSLPITAEGIENGDVLNELRDLGDIKGQGYLYGRPENAAATKKRLAELQLLIGSSAKDEERREDALHQDDQRLYEAS